MKINFNHSIFLFTCMMFILLFLASACNHSAKKLSTANLTDEVRGKIELYASNYAQSIEAAIGTEIPIIMNGNVYTVNYKKEQDNQILSSDCPQSTCNKYGSELREICKENDWPPGHLILVCDPATGTCCNCKCYY